MNKRAKRILIKKLKVKPLTIDKELYLLDSLENIHADPEYYRDKRHKQWTYFKNTFIELTNPIPNIKEKLEFCNPRIGTEKCIACKKRFAVDCNIFSPYIERVEVGQEIFALMSSLLGNDYYYVFNINNYLETDNGL